MCRLRIPNGILKHWQFAGLADLAERYGGGYAHVTTRANLQIREIEAEERASPWSRRSMDLGLSLARLRRRQHPQCHRHADRRHRSAGTDRHPALRARMALPHPQRARALWPAAQVQRRLRRRRARSRCWRTPTTSASRPCEVRDGLRRRAGRLVPPGARRHHRPQGFRARHRRDRASRRRRRQVADAIVRVFIDHGDRTNRNKARLKYVLDAWGFEKFLAPVEEKLGRKLDARRRRRRVAPRPAFDRLAHIGVHPQKQDGLELDRRRAAGRQAHGRRRCAGSPRIARDARRRRYPPDGLAEPADLRRSGRARSKRPCGASRRSALPPAATSIRAGLVACTGNRGCRFAASDTKSHAEDIARWCEARVDTRRRRSTSISPAAIIPARSITSATSA